MTQQLFPNVLRVARDNGAVRGTQESQPACKPHWLTTTDASLFVAKRVVATPDATGAISPLRALTEFAVSKWAQAFGVHVPEVCFLDFDGEQWLGSRALASARPASPVAVGSVVPADAVSRLLALDTFIGNHDRHDGNVLLLSADGSDGMQLYGIDHERSAMALHDLEGDFTLTYANVTTFHAVLRANARRHEAVAAGRAAGAALFSWVMDPLVSGNKWCKVETSLMNHMETVLPGRLEQLPDLIATVCERLGVAT